MPHPRPSHVPLALVAGAVAAVLGAAPALASEGPTGPAPLPSGATPVVIPPLPVQITPARSTSRPIVRSARLAPRRLRHGRASLRLKLSAPGSVRVVMRRMSKPRRGRFAVIQKSAGRTTLSLRLPRRSKGRKLAAGRYRISIRITDAQGMRSHTVRRTLVVL